MRTETITSAQNSKIKMLLALGEKSRTRHENSLFVVEGRKEIGHCLDAGYKVRTLFACPEIIPERELEKIAESRSPWKKESQNISTPAQREAAIP